MPRVPQPRSSQRPSAMTQTILVDGCELRGCGTRGIDHEQRVITEARVTARCTPDASFPVRLGDDRRRIVRRPQVDHYATVARGPSAVRHALQRAQQLTVVGRIVRVLAGKPRRAHAGYTV